MKFNLIHFITMIKNPKCDELCSYSGKLPLSSAEACCGEAGEKEKESAGSIFSIIAIFIGIPSGSLTRLSVLK